MLKQAVPLVSTADNIMLELVHGTRITHVVTPLRCRLQPVYVIVGRLVVTSSHALSYCAIPCEPLCDMQHDILLRSPIEP